MCVCARLSFHPTHQPDVEPNSYPCGGCWVRLGSTLNAHHPALHLRGGGASSEEEEDAEDGEASEEEDADDAEADASDGIDITEASNEVEFGDGSDTHQIYSHTRGISITWHTCEEGTFQFIPR